MKDIVKMAIILIYPDGEVERIPITKETAHINYMIEHRAKSKKFARATKKASFTDPTHQDVNRELMLNGVITMINYNVLDIVLDPKLLDEFLPNFLIYLPISFGSVEQIMAYHEITDDYPQENKMCGTIDKETMEVIDLEGKDYEDFMEMSCRDFLVSSL